MKRNERGLTSTSAGAGRVQPEDRATTSHGERARTISTLRKLPTTEGLTTLLMYGTAGIIVIALFTAAILTVSALTGPSVTLVRPVDGSGDVARDAQIEARVKLSRTSRGLNIRSVNSSSINLYPDGKPSEPVPVEISVHNNGNAIKLRPLGLLAAETAYIFEVQSGGIKDREGRGSTHHRGAFRTGSFPVAELPNVAFEKYQLPTSDGQHTSLAIGPDGKLYAAGIDGIIRRWSVMEDGFITNLEIIPTIWMHEGEKRLLIGFAFDPAATPDSLVAWVSHSNAGFVDVPDWGGKITRLSGPNLAHAEDVVVNLPRSTRDHSTNSVAFGPDGALYVAQGANTSIGEMDEDWGNRSERALSAAILRVDVRALSTATHLPLDVKTAEGGRYDPMDPAAPVKVFASGIRNSYDIVWHSNGFLYVPNNGPARGGRTPASVAGTIRLDGRPYAGPIVPSISNILVQNDYLYLVPPPADDGTITYRYYGHPNPSRGEYVMDGGNPTDAADPGEVDLYPVGVAPDEAWAGYAHDFGIHLSPTGVLEYRGNAFGGALKGHLIVALYGGRARGNIVVLRPDSTGRIGPSGAILGIPGLTDFGNPLDVVEDLRTGYLYVSQMGEGGGITLLRPRDNLALNTLAPRRKLPYPRVRIEGVNSIED